MPKSIIFKIDIYVGIKEAENSHLRFCGLLRFARKGGRGFTELPLTRHCERLKASWRALRSKLTQTCKSILFRILKLLESIIDSAHSKYLR